MIIQQDSRFEHAKLQYTDTATETDIDSDEYLVQETYNRKLSGIMELNFDSEDNKT